MDGEEEHLPHSRGLANESVGFADDKKSRRIGSPPVASAALSPSPAVNQLDDGPRETFMNGRPLEDGLNLQQCKLCKKGIIKNAAKLHIDKCMKVKKEKAQRKKEARELRERLKEQAREEEARKADGDGDAKMNDDSDDDDDGSPEKKANGKASKKVGGKKPEGEPKGKKRKADADAEKGPKNKKKKEEPKPKVPKPKGEYVPSFFFIFFHIPMHRLGSAEILHYMYTSLLAFYNPPTLPPSTLQQHSYRANHGDARYRSRRCRKAMRRYAA